MGRFLVLTLLALLVLGAPPSRGEEGTSPSRGEEGASENYRMGPGDRLEIMVFGEDDLSMNANVGESGLISYPFLGELVVKGKTPLEFEREIASRLKEGYLVNPEVTVTIAEYRKFFVDGHVGKPGGYQFQPGMTARKAITLAGGFGPRADRDKISVVSAEGEQGKAQKARRVGIDDPIKPGDVITVGRSFF